MNKYLLLGFTASWCGPCQLQKPIIEELISENNNIIEVKIIDVDEYPTVANKYNITVVPTLIIEDNNHNEILRYTGVTTKEKILGDLKKQ